MWAYESVFYQIYPLGFCGAPFENDGVQEHRIRKIMDWIPHMKKMDINAVYFSPLFESDTHGYNTRDYRKMQVFFLDFSDFLKNGLLFPGLTGIMKKIIPPMKERGDVIWQRNTAWP